MNSIINDYRPLLDKEKTEEAIVFIKVAFQKQLKEKLNLRRVTAPLFVLSGSGINDDLNGVERPVSFNIECMQDAKAEVVHSLAKWKRQKLWTLGTPEGQGIYTDMNAIRTFETLDNIHSLYVDQWDWEKVISKDQRSLETLKDTVRDIYSCILSVHKDLTKMGIPEWLPADVHFVHSADLQKRYPGLSPKEREYAAAKEYGAVFIIGIGGELPDGTVHDLRSPDYDDWTTPTPDGNIGLNGDLILYDDLLDIPFEISSMGIRVDSEALLRQLEITGKQERMAHDFHKNLAAGKLPLTMGGGIGQSRLCMYLLRKIHIGEVQSSIWPAEQEAAYGKWLL